MDAGAQTAMESYQEVNGEPTAASRALLQGLLREEMGFEGVLVTDWREVRNLHSFHRVAASEEDAVLLALSSSSSLDVSMVPTDDTFYETTLRLAQEGKLPASRLKVSAERVLRLKEWLGLLGPYPSPAPAAPPPPPSAATQALLDSVGSAADTALALDAARASVTLLKNVPPPTPPPSPPPPAPPSPPLLPNSPPGFTRGACLNYFTGTGCDWTQTWACPGTGKAGDGGWAGADGSLGFYCCCEANTTSWDLPPRDSPPDPAGPPLLPLRLPGVRRVLVVGPLADSLGRLSGGWTTHWQGTLIDDELEQVGAATPPPTIVQAMHALAPAMDVTHLQGCELPPGSAREQQARGCALTSSTEELRAAAANADAVVLCLGEDPYTEKPGDLSELELDEGQRALAAALATARTPMALVLVSGRPRLLKGVEQLSAVQAVLQSFLPGPHGGTALAETLLGLHDPSGRLPLSWPVHSSSLLYPHWHPVTQQCDGEPHCGVAWPFGHGLSYALLTYSPLALSAATLPRDGAVTASVTVTNHADHALNHSVLLFAAADYRRIVPAAQELKDFVRLELPPRGSAEARFTLRAEIFAYVGLAGKRLVESGDYSLWLDPMLRPEGAGAGAGAVLRQRRQLEGLEAQASEGAGQRERGGIARLRVEGDCEGVGCASGPPAPSGGGGVPVGMAAGTFVVGWLMGLASAGGVWVGMHRRMWRAAMAKAARVLVRRRRAGGSRTHVGEHDKRGDDCSPEVNMLGMGCRRSDSASSSLADGPSLTPAGSANSLSSIAEEMHQLGREPAGPLERTVAGADESLPMPPELRI